MGKEQDTGFRPSRALKHRLAAMRVTPDQQKLFYDAEKIYQNQREASFRALRNFKLEQDETSDQN